MRNLPTARFVTDANANCMLAVRTKKRICRACHSINLTMQDIFEDHDVPERNSIVTASAQLVAFFQQLHLNSKLSKLLRLSTSTSWKSIYSMLESVSEVFVEIEHLPTRNEIHVLDDIKFGTLKALVTFLSLFEECSKNFSSHSRPTINDFIRRHVVEITISHPSPSPSGSYESSSRNTHRDV